MATASPRVCASSLRSSAETWESTVRGERNNRSAIATFRRPSASSARTSSSRAREQCAVAARTRARAARQCRARPAPAAGARRSRPLRAPRARAADRARGAASPRRAPGPARARLRSRSRGAPALGGVGRAGPSSSRLQGSGTGRSGSASIPARRRQQARCPTTHEASRSSASARAGPVTSSSAAASPASHATSAAAAAAGPSLWSSPLGAAIANASSTTSCPAGSPRRAPRGRSRPSRARAGTASFGDRPLAVAGRLMPRPFAPARVAGRRHTRRTGGARGRSRVPGSVPARPGGSFPRGHVAVPPGRPGHVRSMAGVRKSSPAASAISRLRSTCLACLGPWTRNSIVPSESSAWRAPGRPDALGELGRDPRGSRVPAESSLFIAIAARLAWAMPAPHLAGTPRARRSRGAPQARLAGVYPGTSEAARASDSVSPSLKRSPAAPRSRRGAPRRVDRVVAAVGQVARVRVAPQEDGPLAEVEPVGEAQRAPVLRSRLAVRPDRGRAGCRRRARSEAPPSTSPAASAWCASRTTSGSPPAVSRARRAPAGAGSSRRRGPSASSTARRASSWRNSTAPVGHEHARAEALLERAERVARQPLEQPELGPLRRDRDRVEQLPRAGASRAARAEHGGPDGVRYASPPGGDRLGDEERVAGRLADRARPRRCRTARRAGNRAWRERRDVDGDRPRCGPRARRARSAAGEALELVVAVGRDHERRERTTRAGDDPDDVERRLVRPVQVLDARRPSGRGRPPGRRSAAASSCGPAPRSTAAGARRRLLRDVEERAERAGREERVARSPVARAPAFRLVAELAHDGGLAAAGLARDEDKSPTTGRRLSQRGPQGRQHVPALEQLQPSGNGRYRHVRIVASSSTRRQCTARPSRRSGRWCCRICVDAPRHRSSSRIHRPRHASTSRSSV